MIIQLHLPFGQGKNLESRGQVSVNSRLGKRVSEGNRTLNLLIRSLAQDIKCLLRENPHYLRGQLRHA
jgi:hypothetical protein